MDASALPSRALGLDYGKVKTGIAVSLGGLAPRPIAVISMRNRRRAIREVFETAIKEECREIIVGIPLDRDGKETQMASFCRAFAMELAAEVLLHRLWGGQGVPTSLAAYERVLGPGESRSLIGLTTKVFDEAYTSMEGNAQLALLGASSKRIEQQIDAYAAAALLTRYFRHPDKAQILDITIEEAEKTLRGQRRLIKRMESQRKYQQRKRLAGYHPQQKRRAP